MTLREQIIARIASQGPMRMDEYMATCLLHPKLGYYTTSTPIGAQGDFITAPEVSQMFGELIGLALAQCWLDAGAPAPFTLAELGPGRGTLMGDLLRAAGKVPGFLDVARIVLVEVSPTLRQVQQEALVGYDVTWAETADQLPNQPLFLIANEFFDALPIRQFVRQGAGWRERQVGLEEGRLVIGLGPAQPQPALADRLQDTAEGGLIETATAAEPVMEAIKTRLTQHGGAALLIDYGEWRTRGNTLQAVKGHLKADILDTPGQADLTAHVCFEALTQMAPGCAAAGPTPQGVFLERLGITARAHTLATHLTGEALTNHIAAHRRLTHPSEMGNLFKVLALIPEGAAPPPGVLE